MDDMDNLTDEPSYARPLLFIEMPRAVSDESALQLFDLMQRLVNELRRRYGKQIERAQAEHQRAIDEFFREQEALRRERQFRAAQLNLPLDDDGEPIPF